MRIDKDQFKNAAADFLAEDQSDRLWAKLESQQVTTSKLEYAHVAYYSGAFIVISAMTWLMNTTWERFGGVGLFLLSIIYGLCFLFLGNRLWQQPHRKIPGGLFVTMAVCMVPLAIYGLERATGIWPMGDPGVYHGYYTWMKGSWILMEVGTIAAGFSALHFFRFPFLTAPIALSIWFLSIDVTPLIFGRYEFHFNGQLWVALLFGIGMILGAYLVDRKSTTDYAFWGYLFGGIAFWGGLSLMDSGNEFTRFLYLLVNIGLIWLSIFLQRNIFIILGAIGVVGYICHLAYRVFEHSLLFPFVLSGLGIGVIYLGILYQRHQDDIQKAALRFVPESWQKWVPSR